MRAWATLEPYWQQVVKAFAGKGLKLPRVMVEVDEKWHDTCRHYAAMATDATSLHLAPQLCDLAPESILGILAHEAGHLTDFANPGTFWHRPALQIPLRGDCEVVSVEDVESHFRGATLFMFKRLPTRGLAKHMREWEHERGKDEVENVADALGSFAMGQRIGYTGPESCLVQTLGSGQPRPRGTR